MKINRYRKVHKILKFYSNNFGFRKPYQVLIDGTICFAALKNQINIEEQFSKYLEGSVKLLTTQCIIKEVENLCPATFGALLIIKKFGIHQCGHGKSPVPASDCILHLTAGGNSTRYIVASQDRELQQRLRSIQGVPLLYLHSRTPVLEPPSSTTQEAVNEKTSNNFSVNIFEMQKLSLLNKDREVKEVRKKRKQKGGPNPLSCKKKKKQPEKIAKPTRTNPNKNKKRNRSRLVKKIKSEIMASLNS